MRDQLRLLIALDARRVADDVRHPSPGAWAGVLLPAVLVVGGLWLAGAAARPDVHDGQGRILLGVLASWPVAFQAYPVLFRPADDALLRRLGFAPGALFAHRALRLLAVALAAVAALLVPYASTGEPLGRPLAVLLPSALVAWGVALWSLARAAELTAAPGARPGVPSLFLGPDPELVRAGSLVYAPILPVVAAALAAPVAVGEARVRPLAALVVTALALALVPLARRRFVRALPRFAPHAGELAYAPPPDGSGTELVIGRGLPALLPRRAAAVRARDAVVIGRRFRWAGRLAWPLAVVAVLALLRAGGDADVRGWVAAACVGMLAVQAVAVIALGRLERGRLRWIDRAAGLTTRDRMVGRWATAFGLALGLTLPVGLVWSLTVPTSPGWPWIAGAAAGALVTAAASLLAAGR